MSTMNRLALCALSAVSIAGCASPVESSSNDGEPVAVAEEQPLVVAGATLSVAQTAPRSPVAYRPSCAVLAAAYGPPIPGEFVGVYLGSYIARYESFTPGATGSGAIFGSHASMVFRSYTAAVAGDLSALIVVQACDYRPTPLR